MTNNRLKTSIRSRVSPLLAVLAALALHGAGAAPLQFEGRGVHRFASASGCPPGGADGAALDCNRVALDLPDARVVVDPTAQRIVFDSTSAGDAVVGDVLLQGSGKSATGERVPLSLHVLVRRAHVGWNLDSYVHAPIGGRFTDIALDSYLIGVRDGATTRTMLTPRQARRLISDPALTTRLARAFVTVRPTRRTAPRAADITVVLGVGGMSKAVLRAAFTSSGPDDVAQAVAGGDWAVELEALSNHIPRWVVQRELFLFGLDQHPVMHAARDAGFKDHDKLTFGARGGQGFVCFNGAEGPLEGAAASGQAFMRESFIGLILGWGRAPVGAEVAAAPQARRPGV